MVVTLVKVRERQRRRQIPDDVLEGDDHKPETPIRDPRAPPSPLFPTHDAIGISKTQQPALPLPPPEKPEIDPDQSPRDLVPTTIFRTNGNFFCDFQIPIWSAWEPNTVILYRPKRTDNLASIRQILKEESKDWYPGDHDIKCIKAASKAVHELKDFTTEAGVPVAILLVPKGNIHVKILVRQRNRYMDINYKKTLNIDICLTDSVSELKRRVEVMTGFPTDQQDLLVKNRGMINYHGLYEYEIRDKTSIQLIIQPKYTMKLRVAAFWNKAYKLEVDRTMVIQDLVAGIIWQVFMYKRYRQARYILGCILKDGLVVVEYDNKRLEMDRCLQYYSIPNGAKLKVRPRYSGSEQDRMVMISCERNETVKVQCCGKDNWAMVALKSLVTLNLPLDKIKFETDYHKLNFIDEVGGKPGEIKIKLQVEDLQEIKIWQQRTIQVKLPQGSVQTYHYTDKDTVRDVKLYIEHSGFRLAGCYHILVGDVHLSNHMILSDLPLMPDDVMTLVPDDFPIYLHLEGPKYAFIIDQGMQTLEGLQERMVSLSNFPMTSSFIFNGNLLDHDDTYLYETRIGANCAIFLENQPEMIVLKLRTESASESISMNCMVPSHAKRNAQIAMNSQHLVDKTRPVFEQFLNWRLGGYKKPSNTTVMRNPQEENIQQPGMKPLLHDITEDSQEERSRFTHPETMPGHLVIPAADTGPKKAKKGRRRSAPEARNIGGAGGDFIPGMNSDRDIHGLERQKRNQGTREEKFRMLTPTFRHVKVGLPRIGKFADREKLILHNKRKFAVRNWKPAKYVTGTLLRRKGFTSSLPDIKSGKLPKIEELADEGPEMTETGAQADLNDLDDEDFRRYKIIIPSENYEPDLAAQAWSKTLGLLIAKNKQSDQKSVAGKTNVTAKKSIFSFISLLKKKKEEEQTIAPESRELTPLLPAKTPELGEVYEAKGKQVKLQQTMTDVTLFIDEDWPSKNSVVNAMSPLEILDMQKILPPDLKEEEERGPQDRPGTTDRNDWNFTTYDDENKMKIVNYFDDPLWDEQQTVGEQENGDETVKVIVEEMRDNLDIETVVEMPVDEEPQKVKREKVQYNLVNQGENRGPVKMTKGMKVELGEDMLPVLAVEDAGVVDVLEDIKEEDEVTHTQDKSLANRHGPRASGQARHVGSKKIPKARTSAVSPRAPTERRTGQESKIGLAGGRLSQGAGKPDGSGTNNQRSKGGGGAGQGGGSAKRGSQGGAGDGATSARQSSKRKPSAAKDPAARARTKGSEKPEWKNFSKSTNEAPGGSDGESQSPRPPRRTSAKANQDQKN